MKSNLLKKEKITKNKILKIYKEDWKFRKNQLEKKVKKFRH